MREIRPPFEDWLDAFEGAYQALPAEPELACPNCTRRTLRAAALGRVTRPEAEDLDVARAEGWIALPTAPLADR